MNLNRFFSLVMLACFLFIGCNNKKITKNTIVGKWTYKEMVFLPGSQLYEMTDDQKKEAGEDAKGTIFQFNNDGTYTVTPRNKEEDPLSGSYTIKEGGNMMLKNERHPSGELVTISFPDKNTLRIEHPENKVALVLESNE